MQVQAAPPPRDEDGGEGVTGADRVPVANDPGRDKARPAAPSTQAASSSATAGRLRAHLRARSLRLTGRAVTGSPACQRLRSSARSWALA